MGESPDLIDFTALQKRGLIKKKEMKKMAAPVSKDGFIDFSAMGQDKINQIINSQQPSQTSQFPSASPISSFTPSSSSESSQSTPGFTSFWDQLPGQTPVQPSLPTTEGSPFQSNPVVSTDTGDMATLKVKLEDLEYKLARLTEKLDLITSKL